jgi:hypothetical protein
MKYLIITSITGDKDVLVDPDTTFDNCTYVAFVDKVNHNLNVWNQIKNHDFSFIDRHKVRRNAKAEKILCIPQALNIDFDYIVWHDGTHQLAVNPDEIIKEYGDADMYVFRHAQRRCLYQEAAAVIEAKMDMEELVKNQIAFYQTVGMPPYFGLFEMGCYIRKVNQVTIDFGLAWFEQVAKFSSRDQLSFPFILWLFEDRIKIKTLKGNCSKYIGTPFENEGNKYFINHSNHQK